MEEPKFEEFGLTEKEYLASYQKRHYKKLSVENNEGFHAMALSLGGIATLVYVIIGHTMGVADFDYYFVGLFIFLMSWGVSIIGFIGIVEPILESMHESKEAQRKRQNDRSPIGERRNKYLTARRIWVEESNKRNREVQKQSQAEERSRLNAEKRRQRKLENYWLNLDGLTFESELGDLYRRLGYDVETTPVTGDDGIDLVLKKDGLTTIVQCKSHQQPVGPAIAREIYGALISSKADKAILACTSGFTTGVFAFAKDKPISLVSAKEILALVESATPNSA